MPIFGKEVISGHLQKRSAVTGFWQTRHVIVDELSLTVYSDKKVQSFRLADWHDTVAAGTSLGPLFLLRCTSTQSMLRRPTLFHPPLVAAERLLRRSRMRVRCRLSSLPARGAER